RKEFAKNRPANVPDAPTHASLLATKNSGNTKDTAQEGVRA
ncbi:5,10-methylene tetrahydromethanopterin reductase, partial [Streptomyces viridiviolaceus]